MGAVGRTIALTTAVALCIVCGGCAPYSCGWDDAIERSSTYRVTLGEAYRPGSRTARYSTSADFSFQPIPSCAAIDEFVSGAVFDVQRPDGTHVTEDTCSQWAMTITSPALSSTGVSMDNLYTPSNSLHLALVRDFGGGCIVSWEFTVHAPADDPFQSQIATALPVVLGYRSIRAPAGAAATACAMLIGATAPATGSLICGDVFVATMTTL